MGSFLLLLLSARVGGLRSASLTSRWLIPIPMLSIDLMSGPVGRHASFGGAQKGCCVLLATRQSRKLPLPFLFFPFLLSPALDVAPTHGLKVWLVANLIPYILYLLG